MDTQLSTDVDVVKLLGELPLLRRLPEMVIGELAEAAGTRRCAAGELVFECGQAGDCLYVIASGRVEIFWTAAGGVRITLAELGPTEFFGELALLDGQPRSASALALAPTVLVAVPRNVFRAFLLRHPEAAFALLEHLSGLIRATNHHVEALAAGGPRDETVLG